MKLIVVIIMISLAVSAKHHHKTFRKSFRKFSITTGISNKITTVSNIFKSLNLFDNFTKDNNIKLLLTMNYDLNNIADKSMEAFEEIINATALDIHNYTKIMQRIDDVVNELSEEYHYDVFNQVKGKKEKHKPVKNKTKKINTVPNDYQDFANSSEFMDFVNDFLEKVNNLSARDFMAPRIRAVPSRRNLKVWVPPVNFTSLTGLNRSSARRVYMGSRTNIRDYPFIVSIHIMGEFGCAGSIISRDIIITAASCLEIAFNNEFFKQNPSSIYVRIGSAYIYRGGETIPVLEIFFHPTYKPETLRHNLAMLRLEKRIRFTKEQTKVRRILWDRNAENLGDITDGIVILGWGAKQHNQKMKRQQKLALDTLDVYPLNECKDIYSRKFVSDEHFCAGFVQASGGACNGDIGGPGIIGADLVGVISFGAPTCGSVDAPTVLTKLGFYTPWIEGIMGMTGGRIDEYSRRRSSRVRSSQKSHKSHKSYKHKPTNVSVRYRGEDYDVNVLKDILTELVQTDSAVVDELLYGELSEDFNDLFGSTEYVTEPKSEHLPKIIKKGKSLYIRNVDRINSDIEEYVGEHNMTTSKKATDTTTDNPYYTKPEPFEGHDNYWSSSKDCDSKSLTENFEGSPEEKGLSIEIVSSMTTPEHKVNTEKKIESNEYECTKEDGRLGKASEEKDSVLGSSDTVSVEAYNLKESISIQEKDSILDTDSSEDKAWESKDNSPSRERRHNPVREPTDSDFFKDSQPQDSRFDDNADKFDKHKGRMKLLKSDEWYREASPWPYKKKYQSKKGKNVMRHKSRPTLSTKKPRKLTKDRKKGKPKSRNYYLTKPTEMYKTYMEFESFEEKTSPLNKRAKRGKSKVTKPNLGSRTFGHFVKPWRELKEMFSDEI